MADTADLLGLGEHCEEPSCNLVDFLPFRCAYEILRLSLASPHANGAAGEALYFACHRHAIILQV